MDVLGADQTVSQSQPQPQSQPAVDVDGEDEKMNVDDSRESLHFNRSSLVHLVSDCLSCGYVGALFLVGASASASPTPHDFELAKAGDEESAQVEVQAQATVVNGHADGTQQVSAADYDPSLDRREDEERRVRGTTHAHPNGNGNGVQAKQDTTEIHDVEMIEEEEEAEEEEDDLDDMFAIASGEKKKAKKMKKKKVVVRSSLLSFHLSWWVLD